MKDSDIATAHMRPASRPLPDTSADRDALLTYANRLRALEIPSLSTDAAKSLSFILASKREQLALWIEEKAGGL